MLRSRSLSLRAMALVAVLALTPPMTAEAQSRKPVSAAPSSAGRPAFGLIVKLKAPSATETAQAAGATRGASERLLGVAKAVGASGAQPVRAVGRAHLLGFGRVLGAAEAAQLARQFAARPEVEWAVPNTRERRLAADPNDPGFSAQWWLHPVSGANTSALADRLRGVAGFRSAWDQTTGSAIAPVAVIDTGITAHSDMDANILPGYDFVSNDPTVGLYYANDGDGRDSNPADPGDAVTQADINANPTALAGCAVEPSSWHGTNIAGLIAAVTGNGQGVAGINQDGRVLPVRVAGRCGATLADIVDGMRWAAGLHVDGVPDNLHPSRIINISFGGSEACGSAYQDAINELASTKNAVVVAAAGNEQGDLTRPANCSGVVAVGAVNRDGFKANYSNFGSGVTLMTVGGDPVDFGRWGSLLGDPGLYTIDNAGTAAPVAGDAYAYVFGTSFSAPLVSGAISLMLSANQQLTAAQIIDGLKRSARPHVTALRIGTCSASNPGRCICTTATCGAGLLDASEAVRYALAVGASAVYTAPNWASVVLDNPQIDAAVALGPDVDAPVVPPAPTPAPSPSPATGSGSGGGGALSGGWLAGLALAVLALRRPGVRRRRS